MLTRSARPFGGLVTIPHRREVVKSKSAPPSRNRSERTAATEMPNLSAATIALHLPRQAPPRLRYARHPPWPGCRAAPSHWASAGRQDGRRRPRKVAPPVRECRFDPLTRRIVARVSLPRGLRATIRCLPGPSHGMAARQRRTAQTCKQEPQNDQLLGSSHVYSPIFSTTAGVDPRSIRQQHTWSLLPRTRKPRQWGFAYFPGRRSLKCLCRPWSGHPRIAYVAILTDGSDSLVIHCHVRH
jgi:hypothetical protein